MSEELRITIASPPLPNRIRGLTIYGRAGRKKAVKLSIAGEIATQIPWGWRMPLKAHVEVVRYGTRGADFDNFAASLKPVLDVLQPMHPKKNPMGLGIITNDDPLHLELSLRQEKIPHRKDARTEILVRAV